MQMQAIRLPFVCPGSSWHRTGLLLYVSRALLVQMIQSPGSWTFQSHPGLLCTKGNTLSVAGKQPTLANVKLCVLMEATSCLSSCTVAQKHKLNGNVFEAHASDTIMQSASIQVNKKEMTRHNRISHFYSNKNKKVKSEKTFIHYP